MLDKALIGSTFPMMRPPDWDGLELSGGVLLNEAAVDDMPGEGRGDC